MGNIYTGSNSGKAGLEVTEVDGTPDVFGVSKIIVSNGTLTDNGAGSVTITTGGGGGGGVTTLAFGTTGLTPAGATSGVITVAGTLVVANGGTGATTLTDGGILLGSGTGALTATAQPTNGQLLIGSTGADPVLATLASAGATVTITNTAGGINLEAAGGMAIGDTITTATEGSVLFAGAAGVLAQNNAAFFWDDTNKRLGIGNATPDYALHVNSGTEDTVAEFISTDANATINLSDNTTTILPALTRTGDVLGIALAGGSIVVGNAAGSIGFFGATPIVKDTTVPDPAGLPGPGAGNLNDGSIIATQQWVTLLYTALQDYGMLT